jgi:uncharacterized membrane protein
MLLFQASIILMLMGKSMADAIPGINKFFGYRTKRSMLNKENWDIAQRCSANYMYRIFLFCLPSSIAFLIIDILTFFSVLSDTWFIASLIIQGVILIVSLSLVHYFTEKVLKQNTK